MSCTVSTSCGAKSPPRTSTSTFCTDTLVDPPPALFLTSCFDVPNTAPVNASPNAFNRASGSATDDDFDQKGPEVICSEMNILRNNAEL